ncbi:MAG: hypothetical protein HZA20_13325 [Nitrospirae bacterium]|nr:hypothetical protein [Nitrospirota bacterium]
MAKTLDFRYRFDFPDGGSEAFAVRLDEDSLDIRIDDSAQQPHWAALAFHKCQNCTLNPDGNPFCPAALALAGIITGFKNVQSHSDVKVTVETPERVILCETTAQRGVSSLIGLLMAASGCPRTRFLKPMARFHLPFATEEETIYRAASMYTLAQFFRCRKSCAIDLELAGLKALYDELHIVNMAMAARLRAACEKDSAVNALVILDLFAKAMPYSIRESLDEFRRFFCPYLED